MIQHPKFTFLHLQKCAGTFTDRFLRRAFSEAVRKKPQHNPLLSPQINKFSFGNIRNPWDWYVSWWAFNKNKEAIFFKYANKGFNEFLYKILVDEKGSCHDVNFNEMRAKDIGVFTFRYNITFATPPDFICKTENIKEDIIKCFSKFNLPLSQDQIDILNNMTRQNKSPRKRDYRDYYDKESIELVAYKDRLIREKWDYKF